MTNFLWTSNVANLYAFNATQFLILGYIFKGARRTLTLLCHWFLHHPSRYLQMYQIPLLHLVPLVGSMGSSCSLWWSGQVVAWGWCSHHGCISIRNDSLVVIIITRNTQQHTHWNMVYWRIHNHRGASFFGHSLIRIPVIPLGLGKV